MYFPFNLGPPLPFFFNIERSKVIYILPFCYTIVVEALGALFLKDKDIGMLKGFEASRGGKSVTHAQIEDNTVTRVQFL